MSRSYASILKGSGHTKAKPKTGQMAPRVGHEVIMTKNSAGGYTYTVSDKELLERILILGTNGNTYYSSAEKLTTESIDAVNKMITDGHGAMVVETVKDIYSSGRAPKMDPTFFVLALLTQSSVSKEVRTSALDLVASLRTFAHLYTWEGMRKTIGGKKQFGRGVRSRLLKLVQSRNGKQFAYQATKYRSRKFGEETWSIDDIIKLAHIPSRELSVDSQAVLLYLIKGMDAVEAFFLSQEKNDELTGVVSYLRAVEAVKSDACTSDTAIQLIRKHNLPREVLNTKLLTDVNVWNALLFATSVAEGGRVVRRVTMPVTALLRNLGVMSQRGVFTDEVAGLVAMHLTNEAVLRGGRVHPVAVLVAKTTYDRGAGIKGSLTWPVNRVISNALEEAFYVAFGHIEGTGKRVLHAVDCSGSMTTAACALPNLTACQAVSCLVMEAVRREHKHAALMRSTGVEVPVVQDVMLFNSTGTMVDVRPTYKLADVMRLVQAHNFGTTDCAQPLIKALAEYRKSGGKKGLYDLFVVYTDNETYYAGSAHPSQLLDEYRTLTGLDAKMVVIATTPTSHTIAYGGYSGRGNMLAPAPGVETKYTLNIAGFDLNGPELIRNFAKSGSLGTSDSAVVPAVAEDDGFELVDGVEEA